MLERRRFSSFAEYTEGFENLQSDSQSTNDDGYDTVIPTAGRRLDTQLEPYLGMVADFDLQDGSRVSGILGAASEQVVVVEEWDAHFHRPSGDPSTIAITKIVRITIP
jgi:hypothetical protein